MPEEFPPYAPHANNKANLDSDAQRARAIIASLRAGEPGSVEVFEAFWQLDALPVDEVRDALAAWVGPLPDLDSLDTETRLAHGFPAPPLRLRALSVARDADVLDLGPVAEEQLRLAGKSWDGADVPPEERLDGEIEGSFAGTLERQVLADAEASGETPLFDVVLFGEDSGVVFAAGTTSVIALIAYGKVEMRDRRTRVAIEEAVAVRGVAPPAQSVLPLAELPLATEEPSGARLAEPPVGPPAARAKTVAKKTADKKATKAPKRAAAKAPKGAAAKAPKGAAAKAPKGAAAKAPKGAAAKAPKGAAAKAPKGAAAKAPKRGSTKVPKKSAPAPKGARKPAAKTAKRATARSTKAR